MEKPKDERSISFEGVSDAPVMAVNGVWGGISTDGSVWAALLHERGAIPNIITFEVDEEGRGNPNEGNRVARGDITRDVQAVAMLTPEAAISLGRWLIQKAELALQHRDQQRPPRAE